MAPVRTAPEYSRRASSLGLELFSSDPSASAPRRSWRKPSTRSPLDLVKPIAAKKRPGGRGKCKGCIKRQTLLEAEKLAGKLAEKKASNIRDVVVEAVDCILHVQEFVGVCGLLMKEVEGLSTSLAREVAIDLTTKVVIDVD